MHTPFQRRSVSCMALVLGLLAPASHAAENEATRSEALPAVPVVAHDPADLDTVLAAQYQDQPVLEGENGTVGTAPVTNLSDDIPLPTPAIGTAGPEGDAIVSPASGNPYFLSFAAGSYYPSANEVIDPDLGNALSTLGSDGRPGSEVYAFIMFQKRMTDARFEKLAELGVRPLGYHPFYTLRAAVPADAIPQVANLDFVRWIGVPKSWQKVHPELTARFAGQGLEVQIPVYINVVESDLNGDSTKTPVGGTAVLVNAESGTRIGPEAAQASEWMSNGWQQAALEERGVTIRSFVPEINAFLAEISFVQMEDVLPLDFVQFVEAQLDYRMLHDESTPMILSDQIRISYDGSGASIVGEIDSGMDIGHTMLNHFYGVGWDHAGGGAWVDLCAHGSHVAGTILGLPIAADEGYTGNVPNSGSTATQRVRNVKMFSGAGCTNGGTAISTLFSHMRSDYNDGTNISPKPHVVNNSWGAGGSYIGSEADCRTVDAEVMNYDVTYVFAAGNSGSGAGTINSPGVAKNALTVGSVVDYWSSSVGDPGNVWTSSSRGPAADNRWKPNVVAPGRWIRSVQANTTSSYVDYSGTSMASPHVTGAVAQLADHYSFFRYAPHRVAAQLMATALRKDDATLTTPSDSHLDNYGAGRIETYRAHWGNSDWTWGNWGFTATAGAYTFSDFTVDPGTTRIAVVMHYTEVAASSGAGQALVNDWDLWLDSPPVDTGAGNTGEYFIQQSSRDNTEIRIINNPAAGVWRWKVYPDSASGSVNCSVTVLYVLDDTTPTGSLTVSANDAYIQTGEQVGVTATASTASNIASAIYLDSTASGVVLDGATTTLKDGAVTNLMTNQQSGNDILLGDVLVGSSRSATWTAHWNTEGVKNFSVNARSDNWLDRTTSVNVTVDSTAPGLPTALGSSTHTAGAWSTNPNITYTWTAATDNLSGVDGYGIFTSSGAPGAPSNVKDINAVTSYGETLSSSSAGRYFNIKTVDRSGNWTGGYANTGPYLIDNVSPGGPSGLNSPSHTVGANSTNQTLVINWTAASDAHSGIAGYDTIFNNSSSTVPSGSLDAAAGATSKSATLSPSTNGYYFHIRARDNAGNWGTAQHIGPFYIVWCSTGASATTYGVGKPGTFGIPSLTATPPVIGSTFTMSLSNGFPGATAWIILGSATANIPYDCGAFLNNRLYIFPWPVPVDGSGNISIPINLPGNPASCGSTTYWQMMLVDPAASCFRHTAQSNGLRLTGGS